MASVDLQDALADATSLHEDLGDMRITNDELPTTIAGIGESLREATNHLDKVEENLRAAVRELEARGPDVKEALRYLEAAIYALA